MARSVTDLIIILVHAGIISLKDEFLLKIHVTFILDVFRKSLLWAEEQMEEKDVFNMIGKNKQTKKKLTFYYTRENF